MKEKKPKGPKEEPVAPDPTITPTPIEPLIPPGERPTPIAPIIPLPTIEPEE